MDNFVSRIRKYEPFFGEWSFGEEIGRGSFGRVFTIYRTGDDGRRSVAVLKVISIPQTQEELNSLRIRYNGREDMVRAKLQKDYEYSVNEIDTMEKLNGTSNVVYFEDKRIYDRDDMFGWDILIRMELLVRLDNWLAEDTHRRDLRNIYRIWNDLYEGLKVCETFGLVHMDIKPENIFYSPAIDYFKLGDFGEAQVIDQRTGLAAQGKTVGSYSYMSPEVQARRGATFASDIYSLALVMYQLFNDDTLPFAQKGAPLTEQDHERINKARWSGEPIPRLKNVPKEFMNYILVCLDPDPNKRYRSAAQAQEALRALWYNMPDPTPTRKWVILGSGLVVLAGVVVTLGIMSTRGGDNGGGTESTETQVASQETMAVETEFITDSPTPYVTEAPTPYVTEAPTPEATTIRLIDMPMGDDVDIPATDVWEEAEEVVEDVEELEDVADVPIPMPTSTHTPTPTPVPVRRVEFTDTSAISNDRVTGREMTLSGTGESGEMVLVTIEDRYGFIAAREEAQVDGRGNWTVELPLDALTDGEFYTARAVDQSGDNESSTSLFRYIAPIDQLDVNVVRVTDTQISGHTKASANVEAALSDSFTGVIARERANSSGDFTLSIGSSLEEIGAEAGQTLYVRASDDSGNDSFVAEVTINERDVLPLTIEIPAALGVEEDGAILVPEADNIACVIIGEPEQEAIVSFDGSEVPSDIPSTGSMSWYMYAVPKALHAEYKNIEGKDSGYIVLRSLENTPLITLDPTALNEDGQVRPEVNTLTGSTALLDDVRLGMMRVDLYSTDEYGVASGDPIATTNIKTNGTFELTGLELLPNSQYDLRLTKNDGTDYGGNDISTARARELNIYTPVRLPTDDPDAFAISQTKTLGFELSGEPNETVYVTILTGESIDEQEVVLDAEGRGWYVMSITGDGQISFSYVNGELEQTYDLTIDPGSYAIELYGGYTVKPETTALSGITYRNTQVDLEFPNGNKRTAQAGEDGYFYFDDLTLEPEQTYTLRLLNYDRNELASIDFTTSTKALTPITVSTPYDLDDSEGVILLPDADQITLSIHGEPNKMVRIELENGEPVSRTLDENGNALWNVSLNTVRGVVRFLYPTADEGEAYYIIEMDINTQLIALDNDAIDANTTEITGTSLVKNEALRLYNANTNEQIGETTTDNSGRFRLTDLSLEPDETYSITSTAGIKAFAVGGVTYQQLQIEVTGAETLSDGSILPNEGSITIKVTGERNKDIEYAYGNEIMNIDSATLGDDGTASIDIRTNAGAYTVVAEYVETRWGNDQQGAEMIITIADDGNWYATLDETEILPGARTLSGTAPAGAEVYLYKDGQPFASATADDKGRFTFEESTYRSGDILAMGVQYLGKYVEISDITIGSLGDIKINVDKTFSDGTAVWSMDDNVAVSLKGQPNQTVVIYLDEREVDRTSLDDNGALSIELHVEQEGGHTIGATYQDDSRSIDKLSFTVDNARRAFEIDPVLAGAKQLTGRGVPGATVFMNGQNRSTDVQEDGTFAFSFDLFSYQQDEVYTFTEYYKGMEIAREFITPEAWQPIAITSDISGLVISGNDGIHVEGTAQSNVEMTAEIGGRTYSVNTDDNGAWSFDLATKPRALNDGTYDLTIAYRDNASESASATVTIDTHVLLQVNDYREDQTELTGRTDPGAQVTVFDEEDQSNQHTGQVDGSGYFTVPMEGFDKNRRHIVQATDSYGNTTEMTVETQAVDRVTPSIRVTSGTISQSNRHVDLTVTAEDGMDVMLTAYAGGSEIDTITNSMNGSWSASLDLAEDQIPSGTTELLLTASYADGFGGTGETRVPVDMDAPVLHENTFVYSLGGRTLEGTVTGAARVVLNDGSSTYDNLSGDNEKFSFRLDEGIEAGRTYTLTAVDEVGNMSEATITPEGETVTASAGDAALRLTVDGSQQASYAAGDELTVSGQITGLGEDSVARVLLVDAGNGQELEEIQRVDFRFAINGENIESLPIALTSRCAGHDVKVRFILARSEQSVDSDLTISCGGASQGVRTKGYYGSTEAYGFDADQNVTFTPQSIVFLRGWHYGTESDRQYLLENIEVYRGGALLRSIPLQRDSEGTVDLSTNAAWNQLNRAGMAISQSHKNEGLPSIGSTNDNAGFYIYFDPTRVIGSGWMPGEYTIRVKVTNSSANTNDSIEIDVTIDENGQTIANVDEAITQANTAWYQEILQYTPVTTTAPTQQP